MQFAGLNSNQLLRDPTQHTRYGYVANNPLNRVDHTGYYFGIDNVVGAIAGAVAGAVGGYIASDEGVLNTTVGVVVGAVTGAAVGAVVVLPQVSSAAATAVVASTSGALSSLAGQAAKNAVQGNDVLDSDNYSLPAIAGATIGGGMGSLVGQSASTLAPAATVIGSRFPYSVTTIPQAVVGGLVEGTFSGSGEVGAEMASNYINNAVDQFYSDVFQGVIEACSR